MQRSQKEWEDGQAVAMSEPAGSSKVGQTVYLFGARDLGHSDVGQAMAP